MRLRPLSVAAARRAVGMWHRHNRPPQGGLFAVGCEDGGELVGVAIVGRPVARLLDDGWTAEITRVATMGTRNACSMLYGACLRAARALGYRRVYTYTLASEPGVSLQAAGFVRDADIPARETWNTPSRPRHTTDLFGQSLRPVEAKVRWIWQWEDWRLQDDTRRRDQGAARRADAYAER